MNRIICAGRHAVVTFFAALLLTSCYSPGVDTGGQSLDNALAAAAVGNHRSEKNIARNQYRHPVDTLVFFDLRAGQSVLEITPGGMWYTEILGPALKDSARLTVAGYDADIEGQPKYRYQLQNKMEQVLKEQTGLYGNVGIVKFSPPDTIELGSDGSYDRIVTFRNTHNWVRHGQADQVFAAFAAALKPGGKLGIVQHRAADKQSENPMLGYVSEETVIALAEQAGLKLLARSEINANPADTRDHPNGVWTLPPILRLGEQDRDKYLAIGESDRMTLLFVK